MYILTVYSLNLELNIDTLVLLILVTILSILSLHMIMKFYCTHSWYGSSEMAYLKISLESDLVFHDVHPCECFDLYQADWLYHRQHDL